MKLSAQEEYGLRCVLQIGASGGWGEPDDFRDQPGRGNLQPLCGQTHGHSAPWRTGYERARPDGRLYAVPPARADQRRPDVT